MPRPWSLFAITVAASAIGCSEAPAPAPSGPVEMTAGDADHQHALSSEDQLLADKQKNCPVGGEPLGSMGTPVKMMVGDRAVFLCCEGCRGAVESDPEKYLAILDAATAAPADVDPAATTEAGTPAAEAPAETPADSPATPVPEAPANP